MKKSKYVMIGMKEFRENMTRLHKKALKENIIYFVFWHHTPVFKVTSLKEGSFILDEHVDKKRA